MDNYLEYITTDECYGLFGSCHVCGADNFASSRFCCQCGRPLNKYMMVLNDAICTVKREIEYEKDDERLILKAARSALAEFKIRNDEHVNEATIVAGLKKEFADHEFPKESKQKVEQLKYLEEIGIKLQYEETTTDEYLVTVTTALGSAHLTVSVGYPFVTPGDIVREFCLDDPTPDICRGGWKGMLASDRTQGYQALNKILTDEQMDRLRWCKSHTDLCGVWGKR